MRFIYGKQNMKTAEQAQENCYLLTNGLGGYSCLSMAYSVTRSDQGLLIAASSAPTVRHTLVQRMQETLQIGDRHHKNFINSIEHDRTISLSENGYKHLTSFIWEDRPQWTYELYGVTVTRQITMRPLHNSLVIHYEISNQAQEDGFLSLRPAFLCAPKGQTLQAPLPDLETADLANGGKSDFLHASPQDASLCFNNYKIFIGTDACLAPVSPAWEHVSYSHDAVDGRTADGYLMHCLEITVTCPSGEKTTCDVILSDSEILQKNELLENNKRHKTAIHELAACIRREAEELRKKREGMIFLRDPLARQLAISADAYITRRDSTGGQTIVAGYPFFADWGRDTMISLPGCTLANGRYDTAKSILKTFLEYERGGLVPNLFPEGGEEPRYNTVDAALLLINSVWLYYQRTGDRDFLEYAYPIMQRIIRGYRQGTEHGIHMDEDGLITAGRGRDQVTWMDVCVEGILPTPRHGKPVEINAYWYNALRIMAEITGILSGFDHAQELAEREDCENRIEYLALANRVQASFLEKFWMEEKGYLKDVISENVTVKNNSTELWTTNPVPGSSFPDEQFRCNQIWAITLPFTMLSRKQEQSVVKSVYRKLYTPCGLRTLDPKDPQFHPTYGGPQKQRDLAYHQGTTWVFPLGAFYKAWLRVHEYSNEAREWVKERLQAIEPMLREGCIGQLPEIYDGDNPGASKGCFAQAWSVGEILTVYEMLEREEQRLPYVK